MEMRPIIFKAYVLLELGRVAEAKSSLEHALVLPRQMLWRCP